MSPVEFQRRINRFLRELPDVLKRAAKAAATRITGRSVGAYMRDDKGGGPRSPSDTGPLRILTGAVARAMRNVPGSGGIERISASGAKAELLKGLDPAIAPGGYNEGRIAKSGRDLSFLNPAVRDELDAIRRDTGRAVSQSLRSNLRRAA